MNQSEIDVLADRHLRQDPDGVLSDVAGHRNGVVLLEVGNALAASKGIQHLAWMLTNVLARQFKLVGQIVLDVPDVPLAAGVAAFGASATLAASLAECVTLVAGPHVQVRRHQAGDRQMADVVLSIGCPDVQRLRQYHLYADGWRFAISTSPTVPVNVPASSLALGPYMCASYAAGEVFKILRGLQPRRGAFVEQLFSSLWTMSEATGWDGLVDGPSAAAIPDLGHFYLAGAGAVAQAAVACLGASALTGSCTAIDADPLDTSNDNRYVLATRGDDGKSKTDMVAEYLRPRGFDVVTAPVWWESFVSSKGGFTSDAAIRELEQQHRFPVVLSCVDKNRPRHAIQNVLPGLIVGGSTQGLLAMASVFDPVASFACLKCHNPPESRDEMLAERTGQLKAASDQDRGKLMQKWNLTAEDVYKLLNPSGKCGQLTAEEVERFAAAVPVMSVGFVSLASGVLLVAQWLRHRIAGDGLNTVATETALAAFTRPKIRARKNGLESSCWCTDGGRARWIGVWQTA